MRHPMAEQDAFKRNPAPDQNIAALRGARDLPHNLEAEQAVLGAILMEETAFDQAAPILKSQDFYVLAHQHIYQSCEELARESKPIDPVMVQQRLDAQGLLGGQVPRELPFALCRGMGTAANAAQYARAVSDLSRLRRMMLIAQSVVQRGYEAGARIHDFLEEAQEEVFSAAQGNTLETMRKIDEPVIRAIENLEMIQKRVQAGLSPITGVPTGIATLDKMLLGLQPGALIVLAARPSVGKTAFALNIAAYAATKQAKRVAVFSLEMPSDQLALRMLASEAKLDWRKLSQGQLSRYDWDKIAVHGDKIGRAPIWLDDNFVLSPVDLRAKCRKLKRDGGLDLVIIDYLQLMHSPSDRANQSREQEISSISRSLKGLAKELGAPIMALSQLNRSVEKRKGERPMLSDLRESGAIEQDADVVLFLHRPEEDKENGEGQGQGQPGSDVQEIELIIAKQRQGPVGVVELVFFKTHTFFAEKKREG
jgi:replicative DNA helicase